MTYYFQNLDEKKYLIAVNENGDILKKVIIGSVLEGDYESCFCASELRLSDSEFLGLVSISKERAKEIGDNSKKIEVEKNFKPKVKMHSDFGGKTWWEKGIYTTYQLNIEIKKHQEEFPEEF
ncbi:hypothetical protein [Chondrinema litorale]|uniref:hypothetical protein n=1 Tax=Chondrinema litorale TaxID=2994555 RepID=UPI002542D67D|nr:hypothetical protein [Chondrinema litorale]UZS00294.1 hypothetical protein OQ292_40850 [Chondrinema litorale]